MNTTKRPSNDLSVFDEALSIKRLREEGVKPPLPKELSKLFQPLYCALCKSQLSSPVTAAAHYSGKQHQKKVKQYLSQNFPELLPAEDGNQATTKVKNTPAVITSLTLDQASRCRICNVVFAGPVAAQSHYIGKKHRSKVLKGYAPIDPVAGMDIVEDKSGRFGIGESFRKLSGPPVSDTPAPLDVRREQKFFCDICEVQTTDDTTYRTHLAGKKHTKNVNKLKIDVPSPGSVLLKSDTVLNSVMNNKRTPQSGVDYSIHRTPSGEYYCKVCDLTVNSVSQFVGHCDSKKHKKKEAGTSVSSP